MNKFKMDLQLFGEGMNPDQDIKTKEEFREQLRQALEAGDTEGFSKSFMDYMSNIEQSILREAKGYMTINDSNILSTRGVRQLTSEETKYYQKLIVAMQQDAGGATPITSSVDDIDVVMPETVINEVFKDLKADHELLSVIDFKNVTGLVRVLINKNERQLAQWGPLCGEIAKELESGFDEITLGQNKLSAFMFICQDMLDLGPVWLDRYVREVMYESIAFGLEYGIINGKGVNEPVGMIRIVGEDKVIEGGAYKAKDLVPLNSLDPVSYGQLLSTLSTTDKGYPRVVKNVIMIVNPTDYLLKIMPATTIRAADGTYVNNVLPFPTKIIQSTEVTQNRAIIGMADKYWMGLGLSKNGKIEYSDEYKFLEDYRTYKTRFLGHGEPKDNNAFVIADITNLKPAIHKVEVVTDDDGTDENGDGEEVIPKVATLKTLTLTDLTLEPSFGANAAYYETDTSAATNTISVEATDSEATIEVKLGSDVIKTATKEIVGETLTWTPDSANLVTITVTNGDISKTYTVLVTHGTPKDATLKTLAITDLTLEPETFAPETTSYTTATTDVSNDISVEATDPEATIKIELGGDTIKEAAKEIVDETLTWVEKTDNTVTITVTNGDVTEVYTVTVTHSEG